MKAYTYQLLQYIPDRVSGEFVNVGIVLYSAADRYLKCRTIDRIGRAHYLFPEVNARRFVKSLRQLCDTINDMGEERRSELDFTSDQGLSSITNSVLLPDDSALVFSEENTGIDVDLNVALDDLFMRMVRPELDKEDDEIRQDPEVWTKIYKPYFDKLHLTSRLEKRKIKTEHTEIEIDLSFMNGHLHIVEPTSFNLTRKTNIKNKVFRINGMLQELGTSSQSITVHLLTKMPNKKSDQKLVANLLRDKAGDSEMILVQEDQAQQYIKDLESIFPR